VSRATHLRAQVAALSRPGRDTEALGAARRELASVNVLEVINGQREKLGMRALPEDLAALVAAVALREAA